jgi:hypothetical protein
MQLLGPVVLRFGCFSSSPWTSICCACAVQCSSGHASRAYVHLHTTQHGHMHMHARTYTHTLRVQKRAVGSGSALNSTRRACHSQALFCRPACPCTCPCCGLPSYVWREEEENRTRERERARERRNDKDMIFIRGDRRGSGHIITRTASSTYVHRSIRGSDRPID